MQLLLNLFVSRWHQKNTSANIMHTSTQRTLSLTDNRAFASKTIPTYWGINLHNYIGERFDTPSFSLPSLLPFCFPYASSQHADEVCEDTDHASLGGIKKFVESSDSNRQHVMNHKHMVFQICTARELNFVLTQITCPCIQVSIP